ncbi:hypothetical protein F3K37_42095 [Streptomyces sp. LBUM 1477]|uniref:hypothetical protein n=1 Tax=Streptomyces TaxID=1883 RepID=UPI0029AD25D7|nr:hypothetical protein [Streptomyces scabiei]MBP5880699.1 hypothetical protein [Streptomyces sp. LBUM 1477]MDX2871527.1 hypothetical protein [Streptomyces scabiei]
MVEPTPQLSPEQLERLKELADAARQRAAQCQPPKPPRRRRTRQYPGGRPNPWRTMRLRRRRQG